MYHHQPQPTPHDSPNTTTPSSVAGTYAQASGSAECYDCAAGKAVATTGGVECTSCGAGKYSSEGAASCTACAAGTHSPISGSFACIGCAAGKSAVVGESSCTTCAAGTFSNESAAFCTLCEAGTAASGGASACTACGEGSISNEEGSLCSPCEPGTEADGGNCTSCTQGWYNSEQGQSCRACEVGTTSSIERALSCSPCPYSYTTTHEGSSECDGCIEGYYRDPTVTDETVCLHCPDHAYCAGNSIPGATLLPVPLEGYWSNRSDLALVHYIHTCPRGDEVCTGGLANASDLTIDTQEVVARTECWLPENLTSDACNGDEILWCVLLKRLHVYFCTFKTDLLTFQSTLAKILTNPSLSHP